MPYHLMGLRVSLSAYMSIPRIFRLAALVAPLLLLAGCGGGGGGTPPSSIGIRLVTDWTTSAAGGPTGQSERVRVVKPDGTIFGETVIPSAAGSTTTAIVGPTGAYTVRIDLFSGPNATGTATGYLESTSQSGSSALNVSVGAVVSNVRFVPSSVDLGIGDKIHLGVTGVAAGGNYTFLAPGSVAITSSGAAASVTSDGTATGVSSGTTTVTATSGGKTGTAVIGVAKAGVHKTKWTVMVYLNASNDLYPYALPNVNQMEKVAYNPDVRFVVQWKESATLFGAKNVDFDGTRRYLVKSDSSSSLKSQLIETLPAGTDMGDVQQLKQFVGWTKENYPADRYALIVWNHGNGWQRGLRPTPPPTRAVSYDFETGNTIDTWTLPQALDGQHVDILSFDACLMQMLEVASDVKTGCDFIASSEENTPGPGYPYDRIFKTFADNPNDTTRNLTKAFVDGHVNYPPYKDQTVTQSVIDCTKVAGVETAVDSLAGALLANQVALKTVIPGIRTSMSKYALPNDGRYYYDLVDLAQHLQASASVPAGVKAAAADVITANNAAVVWEGHTELDAFSHGIAIDFSPDTSLELALYGNLNLAKVTRWYEWLKVAP